MILKVNNEGLVVAQNKSELIYIINSEIREKGPKCDLNFIDTSRVSDMSGLFYASGFNGDISKWNTKNVTDMSHMFRGSLFTGDISQWNTGNVKNMSWMFALSLFNGDISKWNVENVENMSNMFSSSYFNNYLGDWKVDNVRDFSYMFYKSAFFRGEGLKNWNTFNALLMTGMFAYARSIEEDLSKWDIINVKGLHKMFYKSSLEEKKNLPYWYNCE